MQPFLVQFCRCHPGEGHTGRGKEKKKKREKKHTHAVVTPGNEWAPAGVWGGSGRPGESPEGRRGWAPGAAGRAVRAAGSPRWLARAQPLAPPLPPGRLAAPQRRRQLQLPPPPLAALLATWAAAATGGARRPRRLGPRSAPPPRGMRGPRTDAAPRRLQEGRRPWGGRCGWEWGGPQGAGRQRASGRAHGARAHREPLGRTAGAPGWTRALWGLSKRKGRLRGADASQGAPGNKCVGWQRGKGTEHMLGLQVGTFPIGRGCLAHMPRWRY